MEKDKTKKPRVMLIIMITLTVLISGYSIYCLARYISLLHLTGGDISLRFYLFMAAGIILSLLFVIFSGLMLKYKKEIDPLKFAIFFFFLTLLNARIILLANHSVIASIW